MSRPAAAARLAALGAATALALAGCHEAQKSPGDGSTSMTPEQSRAAVIDALHTTWRELAALNVTVADGADGAYTQCVDQGGAVEYVADLRLDTKLPADPPLLADRLEPALTAAGWKVTPTQAPPAPDGTSITIHGTKDNITLAIDTYPGGDDHIALLRILGPCIDVGTADDTYTTKTDKNLPLT
jgi:hypothetical protein